MKVYCYVTLPGAARNGTAAERLSITIEMPCVIPVGSSVWLPTPRSWDEGGGLLIATITGWDSIGNVLACDAEAIGESGRECVDDLLSIGYSRDSPKEVYAAYEALLIDDQHPKDNQ